MATRKKIKAIGTPEEQALFSEVNQHYEMAVNDNEARWSDWDRKYELFRNYIDESNWPYSSIIFVPEIFTALLEKSARLNGGKPRGRLIPRETGDVVGARVNNELLNFQWDEASREDNQPMTAKWALMDLQTRIYGSSFAVVPWKYRIDSKKKVKFDGPVMKVLNPKDSLPNPSYSSIKNWFQYREFVTLKELETVNDKSSVNVAYKNVSLLREAIKVGKKGGDTRDSVYSERGKQITGVEDYLGRDEAPDFTTIELVTELRDDRKICFSPRYGIILKDEANPYDHQQIPVIRLCYLQIDDDIWGLSEIEPVEKLQKAINALTSQTIDSINMDLYRILKVNSKGVQMNSLEFAPGKKWLMNDTTTDVIPLETSTTALAKFVDIYGVLSAMLRQAFGETSGQFSGFSPAQGDKTATEIQEGQLTRSVRDNFNKIYLSEAIKSQMMFWLMMNKQFIFSDPSKEVLAIRVLGRDTIGEFKRLGLDAYDIDGSEEQVLAQADGLEQGLPISIREQPRYPVMINGEPKAKMQMEDNDEFGTLYMTPEDMTGNYDYIADVEPMTATNSFEEKRIMAQLLQVALNPNTFMLLQQEGKTIKFSELLLDAFDKYGLKGSEKYFGEAQQQGVPNEQTNATQPAGAGLGQAGGVPITPETVGGLENSPEMAAGQSAPQLG